MPDGRSWITEPVAVFRTLGRRAPIRLIYEASKRLGVQSLLLGDHRNGGPGEGSSPLSHRGVPAVTGDRTIAAADEIVEGRYTIFSKPVAISDLLTAGMAGTRPWWTLDIRSGKDRSDVKWAWQLGRHHHLVILARASSLAEAGDYAVSLETNLRGWLTGNPPEKGIHWYSSLELALRALNWLQIISLAGHALHPAMVAEMWRHLYRSGHHLLIELPYSWSSMRNNHLLGEALGLIALGKSFPGDRRATRWLRVGHSLFERQVEEQFKEDGSTIEDSLSYSRFLLEMLAMRCLLGEPSARTVAAMERIAQFLVRLGVLEGKVPQYGDWDEGRVFTVSGDAAELAGSVKVALALAGSGAPEEWREKHDEVAWHVGEGDPVQPVAAIRAGNVGGGIARVERGPWTVWLKGGNAPSHGHADLSSVTVLYDGRTLTGDPGTGLYNGDPEIRDAFRTSAGHNVVRVSGEDQFGPYRTFRWHTRPKGQIFEPLAGSEATVLFCAHLAYAPRVVVRVVALSEADLEVADLVTGSEVVCQLGIPLHPEAGWNSDDGTVIVADEKLTVRTPSRPVAVTGSTDRFRGWWSPTYGSYVPTTFLDCTTTCGSGGDHRPSIWGFSVGSGGAGLMDDISPRLISGEGIVSLSLRLDDREHLIPVEL